MSWVLLTNNGYSWAVCHLATTATLLFKAIPIFFYSPRNIIHSAEPQIGKQGALSSDPRSEADPLCGMNLFLAPVCAID